MPMSNIPTSAPEEHRLPPVRRESMGERLWRVALRFLALLAPGVPMPKSCSACSTGMVMCGDLICNEENPARVEAVRFWRCPSCGDCVREWYWYPRYPDPL